MGHNSRNPAGRKLAPCRDLVDVRMLTYRVTTEYACLEAITKPNLDHLARKVRQD